MPDRFWGDSAKRPLRWSPHFDPFAELPKGGTSTPLDDSKLNPKNERDVNSDRWEAGKNPKPPNSRLERMRKRDE